MNGGQRCSAVDVDQTGPGFRTLEGLRQRQDPIGVAQVALDAREVALRVDEQLRLAAIQ